MDVQTLTFIFVGTTFALYIGIAIWARAGNTDDFYVAGGGVSPSRPTKEIIPAIEMNEAADIQSAAVAMPLASGGTPPPATKKSSVLPARAQMAMPI